MVISFHGVRTDRQTRFWNPHMETCWHTKHFHSKLKISGKLSIPICLPGEQGCINSYPGFKSTMPCIHGLKIEEGRLTINKEYVILNRILTNLSYEFEFRYIWVQGTWWNKKKQLECVLISTNASPTHMHKYPTTLLFNKCKPPCATTWGKLDYKLSSFKLKNR